MSFLSTFPFTRFADFDDGTKEGFTDASGSTTVNTSSPIEGGGTLESDTSGTTETTNTNADTSQETQVCGIIRTPTNGGQSELWYGVQDSNNLYFVGVDSANNEVSIGYYDTGTKTVGATASATIGADTAYQITLTWYGDGTQNADVDKYSDGSDVATVEFTDTTYTSGGIGAKFTDAGGALDTVEQCGSAAASPPTVTIDDFSDGDLSEYGSNSDFSVDSDPISGKNALKASSSTGSAINGDASNFTNVPSRGDEILIPFVMDSNGAQLSFYMATDTGTGTTVSPNNGYKCKTTPENDRIEIFIYDNGSRNIKGGTVSGTLLDANNRQYFRIDFGASTNSDITLSVEDSGNNTLGSKTFTDSKHDTGDIGFSVNDDDSPAGTYWIKEVILP